MDEVTQSAFFALLNRLRRTPRWGTMGASESVMEHTASMMMLLHALVVISRDVFHEEYDLGKLLETALFHDAAEALTGDVLSPVKDMGGRRELFKQIERRATEHLVSTIPEEMRSSYERVVHQGDLTQREYRLLKAADTLDAYLFALRASRNEHDFEAARDTLAKQLHSYDIPAIDYFVRRFAHSYVLPIDAFAKLGGIAAHEADHDIDAR